MKKIILSAFLSAFMAGALMAQSSDLENKVLFTVEDDTVTAGEYMAVYNKNRNLGEDIDPKTPREYLDLYMNFKLKVHEAKEMGMDTAASFLREYTGYRDQLAKPYLTDKDVTDELVKEAYERMQWDVRASHIMVEVREGSPPKDTLAAWERIMSIKKKIEAGGYFDKLAEEYSDDTYSAERGGDLGFFTSFNMVYPFESAAYNADLGQMVGPIRTQFGYHLVKTTDKRPARGTVTVSHIMLVDNEKSEDSQKQNAEVKIREIYSELKNGADFNTLVKQYSEDRTTNSTNGLLPPFGINKMYPEFEEAAFNLKKPGDFSEPVKTPVGWHILRLEDKSELPEWEEISVELKTKVDRDARSQRSRTSIIKKLKKEYTFREYPKNIESAFDQVDESFLQGTYKTGTIKGGEKVLFEFKDQKFTTADFLIHLEQMRSRKGDNLYQEINKAYNDFSESKLISYEKSRLEEKYSEFRLLSREYFEGILLFDLTEDKVWKKSVTDSAGLQNFYSENKDRYQWKERYQADIIDAGSKKMAKKAHKLLRKGKTRQEIETELNADSQLNVKVDSGLYEAGTNSVLEMVEKEEGSSDILEKDGRYFVVQITKILPAGNKTFTEARGAVISDYQNHLEKEWIAELKEKYEVEVNQEVLKDVIAELESQS